MKWKECDSILRLNVTVAESMYRVLLARQVEASLAAIQVTVSAVELYACDVTQVLLVPFSVC